MLNVLHGTIDPNKELVFLRVKNIRS